MKNTEKNNTTRVVLTSQNSIAIKELMSKLSKQLMKKNENLYRRLASK
ncbi:hypothetical protein [Schwartzia succinivorans]|jgi:hypothetical protein|uniref:Uncharacterized protein n=1 Tax=Schwartzia succinivorans DSM 10502 TaxID=1123243 RepID=A0A1M4YGX5_9FIRM|nr:hypothetical protein [Schwartzia succinivorans]SHF04772.1 hypothetical protein SAMN02745190_01744 [Schwartzia succinivorans DSM 10502]